MSASSKVSCSLRRIRTRMEEGEGVEVFERFEGFEEFEGFEGFEGFERR